MKKKVVKNVSKKKVKKVKKVIGKPIVSHELVVRVQDKPLLTPDLFQPMKDGKKMTLTPTWINESQLIKLVQKTPTESIYKRPGKGGQTWTYVTGNYVEKVLNFVFAWNWDFEVVEHGKEGDQIWVHGKLTVKSAKGETISKSQFGRADIKYKKDSKIMLDFGNDLKAATTDALKKCASLLGIASDIYGKQEYKQEAGIEIKDVQLNENEKISGPDGESTYACKKCGDPINEQEAHYSVKVYGKMLCREHQVEAKRK